jgi:hypothetical protein
MPKTNGHLEITPAGTHASQIELFGDRSQPEQDTFILKFPGGFVQVSRCTNGDYIVHAGAWEPQMPEVRTGHRKVGEVVDYGVNCFRGVREFDCDREFPPPIATANMHVVIRQKDTKAK